MKTKKFEAKTEQTALEMVKDDLGPSAIVLSIKKKRGRGFWSWFKKPMIIVTAAYDEVGSDRDKVLAAAFKASQRLKEQASNPQENAISAPGTPGPAISGTPGPGPALPLAYIRDTDHKDDRLARQQQTIQHLEEMLARVTNQLTLTKQTGSGLDHNVKKYEDNTIQMFYDSLVTQGVSSEIAEKVLEDANRLSVQDKQDINLLVKIVYNNIIGILGKPRTLVGQETGAGYEGAKQVVVFMGPTGVGKTTTIAKLSSILMLSRHKQVGLITADTYRIAAVEQLRTYAEIMGLNLAVIYNSDEIISNVEQLKSTHDVILIDTAGRSHHNTDNILELGAMLNFIPDSNKFLVLSVTTRQEDMLSIIKTYEAIADFDLIFTKLDESGSLGVLLNICYLTGKKVAYVSFGQNVPEDIEEIQPDKIAKALMGTGFDGVAWGGLT